MAKDVNSTKEISKDLLDQISISLGNVKGWGSIEIYIDDFKVTQITEKTIRKEKIIVESL